MKQNLLTQVSHRVLTVAALLLVALFANAQTNVCKNTTTGTEYSDIQAAINAVAESQTIQILQDVDITKTITVAKTTPAFTLDLNGCVLNASNIAAPVNVGDKANVIYNAGTLTIVDNAPSTEHKTWNEDHGVATTTVDLTDIKGGVLTGGQGYKYYYEDDQKDINLFGGAILNFHGTLTVSGGTLCNNKAEYGGAIDNAFGTLTISNCTLTANKSTLDGGAISNYGTLTINDGTVIKNNTSNSTYHTGGVYSWNDTEEPSSVTISGKVIITDNTTNSAKANLCLAGTPLAPATISNLKEGSNIGVTTEYEETEGAYQFTANGTEEDLKNFSADNTDLTIHYFDDHLGLVLSLDENAKTNEQLTKWKNAGGNVQIGRTFDKDGTPNSLCLPFSLSADALATSPLAGYTKLQEFASAQVVTSDGTNRLEITMVPATEIVAGKPYFITWPNDGGSIVNPVFKHVTLTADEPFAGTESNGVKYVGTFTYVTLDNHNFFCYDGLSWREEGDYNNTGFHATFYVDYDKNPSINYGMPLVIVDGDPTGINNVDADPTTGSEQAVGAGRNGKFIKNGSLIIRSNGKKYNAAGQLLK